MKALKKIIIIIAVLAIILVGGIYVAAAFIDKGFVEKQVSEAIGRELKISGELSPKISLSPTLKITDATLANAEWGSEAVLAQVGELEVSLQLLPLISSEVQIDSITLKNSEISLEKNKEKWNFDFSKEDKAADDELQETAQTGTKFNIDNINIENVKLSVKDGKTSTYDISKLSIGTSAETSEIALAMLLDKQKINLTGQITPLGKIAAEKNVDAKNLDLTYGDHKIKANIKGNLDSMQFNISNLHASLDGNDISGNLSANLAKSIPYISGTINLNDIDLTKNASTPPAPAKEGEDKASAELYSKEPLPLEFLKLLNADLEINAKSVKATDKITLTQISIPTKISEKTLNAKNITMKTDDATINANLRLTNSSSSIDADIKSFEAAKLVLGDDFKGGSTNASVNLTSSGNSIHSLVNNLSGTSKIHLSNASYSGEVKDGLIKKMVKLLAGGTASASTKIDCVIVNANWTNGIGKIEDFGVITDNAVVTGSGKIKLPTQKLKIVLKPEAKNIGLTDLVVPPIAVSGTFNDISIYPEAKGTAVEAIKTAAGIASGVGILAKIGEVVADKTGVTESIGLKEKNVCAAE